MSELTAFDRRLHEVLRKAAENCACLALLVMPACSERPRDDTGRCRAADPTCTPLAEPEAEVVPPEARVVESRQLVAAFSERLGAALAHELESGGPMAAVTICAARARVIARDLPHHPGWSVRRTSLFLRNPENAPDAWEREVLEGFEEEHEAGTPLAELEAYTVVDEGGRSRFRYMKAIPVVDRCLACHGEPAPDMATLLDRMYPEDDARGFLVGDLRGAFSVSAEL